MGYFLLKLLQVRSILLTALVVALWFTTVPLALLLYRGILRMPRLTEFQGVLLILFSGLYFDYMATLIMLWRQADLIAFL